MAKQQEVLLVKNVLKLGSMGDIVKVKAGYARNYLFPSNSAIPAGQAAKRQIEILKERAVTKDAECTKVAAGLKKKLDGKKIEIQANVSHDKQLFGSVGITDIVAVLKDQGIELDPKQVSLSTNIKEIGVYDIELQLFNDITASIKLTVKSSNPDANLEDVLKEAEKTEEEEGEE